MQVVPLFALIVTALALYVSRGVLDQIFTPAGLVRVALLPPWQTLGAFLALGALGLLWLDRRAVPRGTATSVRPPLGPLLFPTFALLLLVVPYLPLLPDAIPALQVLAGPLRWVIWLIVGTQLLWTLSQSRLLRFDVVQKVSLTPLTIGIALATTVITGTAALRLAGTALYPGGDEPHYIVIAQSLWRDGDLKIQNNHARGDHLEYFPHQLAPHYLTRGADREIYSIHPIGMPVLIAPIYAAGGYAAVVATFVLLSATAAGMMWRTTVRATNALGASTFAWAAVVATSPFLFNAFAVYPEIPAALAVTVAFTFAVMSTPSTRTRWIGVGLACAALPWLSTKYAPMSAALVVIAVLRSGGVRSAALVAVPYGLSLLAWFYFFYAIWGVPLPQAPYGHLVQTDIANLIFGAPGLLFDQEYGLLVYAPVYVLALTGLWTMSRTDAESRRRAVEIIVIVGALLGTVGAFRIWWGGSASPGRPLTSGLLLLCLPIAFAFRSTPMASAQRAAQHLLLWASIGVAGILLFAQQGFLTSNGRDGTSALLEYLSPRWPAWTMAPSFIHHEAGTALFHTAVWLALAVAAAALLRQVRTGRAGVASIAAIGIVSSALLVAAVVMPRLPLTPEWPRLDIRARARLPLLDDFDASARPVAVEYSPLRRVGSEDLVMHASVGTGPGVRKEPQPVRVLHNGRFSLPAGTYRIDIVWNGTRAGETIGLQMGRNGDAWQQWKVDARMGERWTAEFTMPVDAAFVGLRGTPELERVIGDVRFTALTVVDAGRRPRVDQVIAAVQSGPASLFFYDTDASPEGGGFWVWGGRDTRVSIHRPQSDQPLTLRVHSGPIANRLRVSTFGWSETVPLQPHKRTDVQVAAGAKALVTLDFAAEQSFVPQQFDPTSTDVRPLGVWVEVVQ